MVWAPGTEVVDRLGQKWLGRASLSPGLSGEGTLASKLVYKPSISTALSGAGTLATRGLRATVRSGLSGTGTLSTTLAAPRYNLFTHPSAEDTGIAWTTNDAGAVVKPSDGALYVGSRSYELSSTAAVTGLTMSTPLGKSAFPVASGRTYTLSFYGMAINTRTGGIVLEYYDAAGNDIGGTYDNVGSFNSFWARKSVTHTAPANAAYMMVQLYFDTIAAGDYLYFDAFLLEASATVGTYFDGSSTASGKTYSWLGVPNASVSREAAYVKPELKPSYSGDGSLSTKGFQRLTSAYSGSGVLATGFTSNRSIASDLSGSGTLTSKLSLQRTIVSHYDGTGTLTASGLRKLASDFAGEGSLDTVVPLPLPPSDIISRMSGYGMLTTEMTGLPVFIKTSLGSEGVLYAELGYVVRPAELADETLGKLASFSVATAAVPVNPAEGSGSTPSVNAGYTEGRDPEFALGETKVLKNGAVGRYEGEVVKVGTSLASGVASISLATPLTPLNVERHLFPFIDKAPGLWTAARAVDYWTQQAGLFYDKVPGRCLAYASGFGHTDSYGAGVTARFYERLTKGATATEVVNGRSVRTLGDTATAKTAFHEDKAAAVQATLLKNRKLIFSTGLALRGTGRTTTVEWAFKDSKTADHTVVITATSEGTLSASVDGATVASTSVPAGGSYRVAFSLERVSATALVGKLSAHTDDLAGTGELASITRATVLQRPLLGVLRLNAITHAAAGGTGAQMLRWGTYLTVDDKHPAEVPAIQKVLMETKKPFGFVSGFTGNVWNLLNEFCSIARLEVRFIDGAMQVGPRSNTLAVPGKSWARFETDRARRETYKQVAIVNKRSHPVDTDDAVLWRADSVYQVAAREVYETTVQTEHSILNVVQPVAVSGIEPFPYVKGGGQYVVTGADGYIISPQWWYDNGGKVEVSLTGKEGEIAIKITAPQLDTVRAPYRISEGEADRPALYVCGSGILNKPEEVHISTGAKNAREGFDNVFESPFIAGVRETYDTAVAMAHEYSASVAEVQYELANGFDTPTGLGTFPAGTLVTDNSRNYRIQDASQTHSRVSGNAVAHTTIGAYVASYPAGATLKDEKARHPGRTIRKFNIKPLKGDA